MGCKFNTGGPRLLNGAEPVPAKRQPMTWVSWPDSPETETLRRFKRTRVKFSSHYVEVVDWTNFIDTPLAIS